MASFAVVCDRGRRFTARPGDEVRIDLRAGLEPGSTIVFDEVELLADESGVKVGTPVLKGATVVGEVKGEIKGKKVIVFKYRRRKSSRRRRGARATYTRVEIKEIKV